MNSQNFINKTIEILLSANNKERTERVILFVAITSYLIHLVLIFLVYQDVIQIESKLFNNPIAAIYTPFSFILLYEVYLLVFYIPKSITTYIGKQYEIITLIVIRKIFKDISNLELTANWFQNNSDLKFSYDVGTSLILFFLIYLFYQKNNKNQSLEVKLSDREGENLNKFIFLKKGIAVALLPILIALVFYTFFSWTNDAISNYQNGLIAFEDVNKVFFDEFFTILIITDVLLLLLSFFYSDEFHKIIRNSGFVISTILIKISFSVEGIVSNALIVGAVLFGYLILVIHDLYDRKIQDQKK